METIIKKNICEQYLEDAGRYSLYVNRMRSLPDVKDGLKPIHRRILYAGLNDSKCIDNKVKSSKLQGDVMGKYHPHGDSAIYGAMKPMANWFETYKPLLVGKGNWGNFQGDPQSAPRYTEVKLSKFALECVLGKIKEVKEVVDWSPTYDDKNLEPVYLPVEVPLLLINGSYGIGYGISVNVPKHNINEVIDTTINYIRHPNSKVVLVPDTCMPCEIIEADFETISNLGYGTYTVRGIIDIEKRGNKYVLIIRSVPDLTYLDTIIEKLEKLVANKQLPQIHKLIDKSIIDKEGRNNGKDIMHYEIELKAGADPMYVRDVIYKNTLMQDTVSVNMEVVYNYNPVRLSYKSYLDIFLDMRKTCKIRYYYNMLSKVNTKLHEIDAYVKLLSSGKIEDIEKMIKSNTNKGDEQLAKQIAKVLKITDFQAFYIINVNLKKLSPYHLGLYQKQVAELEAQRDEYINKIKSEDIILDEIVEELKEYKRKYGEPRHSRVIPKADACNIPKGKFKLIITEKNFIKKLPAESNAMGSFRDDRPKLIIEGENTENILIFTKEGKVFKLPIHKIPLSNPSDSGSNIQLISNKIHGNIITVMYEPVLKELSKMKSKFFVSVVTADGFIKRMDVDDFLSVPPSGILYVKLQAGDLVSKVYLIGLKNDIVLWNNTNKALRLNVNDIPHLKRSTKGVMTFSNLGMTQTLQNRVGGMSNIKPEDTDLLVITNNGKINRLSVMALPRGKRNTTGSKVIKLGKKDSINCILSVNENDSIFIQTNVNKYTIKVSDLVFGSSASSGNQIINKSEHIIDCKVL